MQVVTQSTDSELYMSAGWFRTNLHVTYTRLLPMVARGLVRTRTDVSRFPTYSVEDVKACMTEKCDAAKSTARKPKRK